MMNANTDNLRPAFGPAICSAILRALKATRIAYPIGALKFWLGTRRSALSTIAELERQNITPRTIVDAGCNRSQWSRWLARRWPDARIHSIDVQYLNPLGKFYHCALSDKAGEAFFTLAGPVTYVNEAGQHRVRQRRLDTLPIEFDEPCVLKIDCEASTWPALLGASGILPHCSAVVVEMTNTVPDYYHQGNTQMQVVGWMADHGFTRMECVDASVWPWRTFYWDALFMRPNAAGERSLADSDARRSQ